MTTADPIGAHGRQLLERAAGLDQGRALARRTARTLGGPGRPEAIWSIYEAEIGPLAALDEATLVDLLTLHLYRARGAGELVLRVPRVVYVLMREHPQAGRRRATRRGRKLDHWLARRLKRRDLAPVIARKAELKARGVRADEAEDVALLESVPDATIAAKQKRETLRSWLKHPARRGFK